MSSPTSAVGRAVLARLGVSAYDLPTQDKIPIIRAMMVVQGPGLSLDIGIGTGYTTYSIFGDRPTVCVDIDSANLRYYQDRVSSVPGARAPLCVVAQATALPFKAGVFRFVLCSEVLEHLEHDDVAIQELARIMSGDGTLIITVPYIGIGFTSFLELLRVKTVHDFPGPERHVRPGYDVPSLARLLATNGLEIQRLGYYLRFFTRLATDLVSLGHLIYQRLVHHRRSWTWSDVTASEQSAALQSYALVFPILWTFSRLDKVLSPMRGFGLVAAIGKSSRNLGTARAVGAPAEYGRS